MKPPICVVCNNRLENPKVPGGLLRFSDYQALPEKMVGHPRGLGWFCAGHYSEAAQLIHLDMAQAIEEIKKSD